METSTPEEEIRERIDDIDQKQECSSISTTVQEVFYQLGSFRWIGEMDTYFAFESKREGGKG